MCIYELGKSEMYQIKLKISLNCTKNCPDSVWINSTTFYRIFINAIDIARTVPRRENNSACLLNLVTVAT